ncbi:hypothetical protein [Roseateles sp.]|uniref:hypothetical protein n=1 Tax=Roseateles sp. TaxID=1971397 RepID=UPI003BA7CE9A
MQSSAFDLAREMLAHTLTCDQIRTELSSQTGSLDGSKDLVHLPSALTAFGTSAADDAAAV